MDPEVAPKYIPTTNHPILTETMIANHLTFQLSMKCNPTMYTIVNVEPENAKNIDKNTFYFLRHNLIPD